MKALLVACAGTAALTLFASAASAQRRRADGPPPTNILFVLIDDVGVDMIPCYGEGAQLPPMPNIDALRQGSVLFRNVWTAPVCSPSRAEIQTGRYGFRTGIGYPVWDDDVPLQLDEITIPEMLDLGGSGFSHAAIGKWHLGNAQVGGALAPNLAGYGYFEGSLMNTANYFSWQKIVNGATLTSNTYHTSDVTNSAVQWIQSAQEPWLCYVSYYAAHDPYHVPPAELHTSNVTPSSPIEELARAMLEAADTEIGRLFAELGPKLENTTIIFMGDNGTPGECIVAPHSKAKGKDTIYEGGLRVPLLIAGPHVTSPGSECSALVSSTDLFATIADVAGVDLELTMGGVQLDSVSLMPYLADPSTPSLRATMLAERFVPNGAGLPPGGGYTKGPLDPPVCQLDLGYGGPGTTVLGVCGDELTWGGQADLVVHGARPFAPFVYATGFNKNPIFIPAVQGTLVPSPPMAFFFPLTTNGLGEFSLTALTGKAFSGSGKDNKNKILVQYHTVLQYHQIAVFDPSQPGGFSISNAVQSELKHFDVKAIRDSQYKLIRSLNGGPEMFFDLAADPFENNDLILRGMTKEQTAHYEALKAEMQLLLLSEGA